MVNIDESELGAEAGIDESALERRADDRSATN
jgi:hypothetical protein